MPEILTENNVYKIEYEHEYVCIIEKTTNSVIFETELYGNVECGLIDTLNHWIVFGGEYLIIWTPENTYIMKDIKWVDSLRVNTSNDIEVLTDPWSDNSAIWKVSTDTFEAIKIKKFEDYKGLKYTENVVW